MLEVIYVVRHAFRLGWTVNPTTGVYSTTTGASLSPTGIAADPVLSAHGVAQSLELAQHLRHVQPPVDVVYSSPWYRCLQTLKPFTDEWCAYGKPAGKVKVEPGLGEFFGTAHFKHPSASSVEKLSTLFDNLDRSYTPVRYPNAHGETIQELHDRIAYTLNEIIAVLDADPSQPKSLLICTHAASMIAIGRVLTGQMPADPDTLDFKAYTASLSRFRRKTLELPHYKHEQETMTSDGPSASAKSGAFPKVRYQNYGIRGFWECEQNANADYLSGGPERGW
ncbi:phosphoglycerate mutase-like protein [Delitschia confertaspora ATCC 74209]|uniref:Phosphoglycerate mutase-like protein n=1 Tax=Delitschia confertaspora ATCC 74209 TaxID=1513339 RepID=A0A9P4JJA4_9PLEO|nr:phosphoglycerate mutase-like protein [Delitschia confertaspora ATCC 74209]